MATINIMALRHSAFYAPLLMTIKAGYLQKQGLQPEYRVATPDDPIEQNLRAGTAHLSQSAPAVSFNALEQGQELDIVHFASINNRDGFYLTSREPVENFQWTDLEDQEVLVDHLFQPYATLRYQQGPAPQQLENDGIGFIAASIGHALGPIAFSSLCATREWLETDMAQAFVAAYHQGMNAVVEMPSAEISKIIHPMLPNIDEQVLMRTLDDYKKLNTWDEDISINSASYENLLKVFLHSGYITREHPMDSCVANLA